MDDRSSSGRELVSTPAPRGVESVGRHAGCSDRAARRRDFRRVGGGEQDGGAWREFFPVGFSLRDELGAPLSIPVGREAGDYSNCR